MAFLFTELSNTCFKRMEIWFYQLINLMRWTDHHKEMKSWHFVFLWRWTAMQPTKNTSFNFESVHDDQFTSPSPYPHGRKCQQALESGQMRNLVHKSQLHSGLNTAKVQNEVHQDNTGKTLNLILWFKNFPAVGSLPTPFLMFLIVLIVIILLFEEKNQS